MLENNSAKELEGYRSHHVERCVSNLALYLRIIVVEIIPTTDCDSLTLCLSPA